MTLRRRSKLDMTSIAFLIVGFILFLIAGVCYLITAIYLLSNPGAVVPILSLTQFGNIAGISGMLVVPMFIVTAIILNIRHKRRKKRLEQDIGDNTESGAAEGSRSDRLDS